MSTHSSTRRSIGLRLPAAGFAGLTAAVAVATIAAPAAASAAGQATGPVGAVYVASNSWTGNQIITFPRLADGTLLAPLPGVATGGLGSGPGAIPGVATDPLGSDSSLVVDAKEMRLFAVNAGSNSVSMFTIKPGGITLVDTAPSQGQYPVSIAVNGDTVYVLNSESNSVTRFAVAHGQLNAQQTCALPVAPRPLDPPYPATTTHSEQPVATEAPGMIGLSPDGKHLVVVGKEGPVLTGFPLGQTTGNGEVDVYGTAPDGTVTNCDSPTAYVLPENAPAQGKFPFSFAWSAGGQLLLTEVFGTGATLPASALQPFTLNADGSLTPLSAPVGDGQIAVCWISVSGQNVYTTNYLTNDISSYTVSRQGSLAVNVPIAGGVQPGTLVTPIDQTLSPDGHFLYQLSPGNGAVVPFAINGSSGGLTQLTSVADGLGAGQSPQGIAAVDYQ
ncbi:MAG TPA: beta-propeller fold lactonase family protein [Candidatus Dormibacteraeota bacterium]|nr:beta-propeller fold lactonase family protein [Candidatus Dormibacteraeota bacterium]